MDWLRTPDERFAGLPDFPFEPRYTEVADGEGGRLRIHHVDEGPPDGPVVLCLHGQPTWGYLYRHMIPRLTDAGLRVVVPDLPGFGRSDKPAAREDVTYGRQVAWMSAWLRAVDLTGATLVCQDWGGLIGLRVLAEEPERFARVVAANTGLPAPVDVPAETAAKLRELRRTLPPPTAEDVLRALSNPDPEFPQASFLTWQKWCWETEDLPIGPLIASAVDGRSLTPAEVAAYDAPFPEPRFKMGPRAMPSQVPLLPEDPAVPGNLRAWEVLGRFEGPFLCVFTDNDPITRGLDRPFRERVPGARGLPHRTLRGGGHFLQEGRAAELADAVTELIRSTPGR